jgi:hypothetical protein
MKNIIAAAAFIMSFNSFANCSTFDLTGEYSCKMMGENKIVTIVQNQNNFALSIDGDPATLIADGLVRDVDGDATIANCVDNKLEVSINDSNTELEFFNAGDGLVWKSPGMSLYCDKK